MVLEQVEEPKKIPKRGIVTYAGPLGLGLFDCEYTPLKIGRIVLDTKELKIKVEHYQVELKRTGTLPLIRASTENYLYGPFGVPLLDPAVKSVGFVRNKAIVDVSSEVSEIAPEHPVTDFLLASLFFNFTGESTLGPGPTTLPGVLVGFFAAKPPELHSSKVTALGFAKTFEMALRLPIDEVVFVDHRPWSVPA